MPYLGAVKEKVSEALSEHEIFVRADDASIKSIELRHPEHKKRNWVNLVTTPDMVVVASSHGCYAWKAQGDGILLFGSWDKRPSLSYLSEKLIAPSNADSNDVSRFSRDLYQEVVEEWYSEVSSDLPEDEQEMLWEEIKIDLLDNWSMMSELDARSSLDEFHWVSPSSRKIIAPENAFEWKLTDYSDDYLWNCCAVFHAIEMYREASSQE